MKRIFVVVVGAVFVVAGLFIGVRGLQARSQVRNGLAAEHIITPPDAKEPNKPVTNARLAQVQVNIIEHHTMTATGGKTYAQMDKADPNRTTAFNSAMLRSALYSSILASNLADFVAGMGALLVLVGLGFGVLAFKE